jgi:hypothetical protein
MANFQVVDGGDRLQTWKVTADILNKQSWTDGKGWSPSLGIGSEAKNSLLKK